MKQKKLRELVNIEFAKALAAEKARVDKENAFRLGRFCVENHLEVFVEGRPYIIHVGIDNRFSKPEYEFSLSRRYANGRVDGLYHLDDNYVINFILTHQDAIYEEYTRLRRISRLSNTHQPKRDHQRSRS